MHMLAYNLIRKTIAIAAAQHGVQPYQISFKGALQTLMNFLASLHVGVDLDQWCIRLISAIASDEIGNRPDRVEPRGKKRRPKPYDAMTKPRSEYKKAYQWTTYVKLKVPFGLTLIRVSAGCEGCCVVDHVDVPQFISSR